MVQLDTRYLRSSFLFLLALCSACSSSPPQTPPPAEQVFAAVESHLLAADNLLIRYTVRSQGAFTAEIAGILRINESGIVELNGEGSFGGTPVTLHLVSDAARLTGRNGSMQVTEEYEIVVSN